MPKIQFKIINPVILVSLQGQRQKFNSTVCGLQVIVVCGVVSHCVVSYRFAHPAVLSAILFG